MLDPTLLGHEPIRRRLLERLEGGRLTGSMLFSGPDGIGKRRVALELAQRELCLRRCACGQCEGCRAYKTDPLPTELPNLLRIAPEGKAGLIRIGMIRESDLVEGGVIRWAHQAPPPRCQRWILVEDAHRLNGASANMLLKILEEPPPGTHFLLVTHRPEAVLQTIRSRCERIPFKPLDPDSAWAVARSQGWEAEAEERWVALANGTLRLLDPGDFARACAQVEAWIALAGGASLADHAAALLPEKASEKAQSEQMAQAFEVLLTLLADVGRLRAGEAPRMKPWRDEMRAIPGGLDLKKTHARVQEALRHLVRNPSAEGLVRDVVLSFR